MQRKVVKQGNGSMTVSLPIQWTRQQQINEGENLELVPSGDYLILGSTRNGKKRTISLEVKDVGAAVKKLIAVLYRSGYDEINLTFNEPEIADHLNEFVWMQLVGFETVQVNKNQCQLKDIAELDPESFSILFKKCFLLLLNFKNELIHYLETKDAKGLSEIIVQDKEVNKITNLCIRLLNKKMNDRRKIAILATVIKGIENLGDDFKDLASCYLKRKTFPSKREIEDFKIVGDWMNKIYHFYFNFDLNGLLRTNEEMRIKRRTFNGDFDPNHFLYSMLVKMELLLDGPLVLNINPDEVMKKEDWIA